MNFISVERLNRRYAKEKLKEGLEMWMIKNQQKFPRIYKITIKVRKEVYKSFFSLYGSDFPEYIDEVKTVYAWAVRSYDKKSGGYLTYSLLEGSKIFYRDKEIMEIKRMKTEFRIDGTRIVVFPTQNGFASKSFH